MEKKVISSTRCINPFTKKGENLSLPCGKCVPCKKRRVSTWSFRLQKQLRVCKTAWFVTFTYTTDTVPISEKGRMTLDKRDFQLFMKRLRKAHSSKIVYYLCGEYGTEKFRPHYHAIMFDVELDILIGKGMARKVLSNRELMLSGKTEMNCPLWYKEENGIRQTMGHITIGQVSAASIGYVLEYISKPERIPQYKGDDRIPEFSMMSKGIGQNYVTMETIAWHKADLYNRYFAPLQENKKAPLSRYLAKLIYTDVERENIGMYIRQMEYDQFMTMTGEEKWKYNQNFVAVREVLLTTADRDNRSLTL